MIRTILHIILFFLCFIPIDSFSQIDQKADSTIIEWFNESGKKGNIKFMLGQDSLFFHSPHLKKCTNVKAVQSYRGFKKGFGYRNVYLISIETSKSDNILIKTAIFAIKGPYGRCMVFMDDVSFNIHYNEKNVLFKISVVKGEDARTLYQSEGF